MGMVAHRSLRLLVTLAGLSLAAARVEAQAAKAGGTCERDFDGLVSKIETDYVGFVLGVKGEARTRFDARVRELRQRASHTSGDACFFVYRDLVDYFHDPHLFIYEREVLDSAEVARRAATVEHVSMTEQRAREYLQRAGDRLDPLEGIWYDGGLRVAIVADPSGRTHDLLAVVLRPDTAIWKAGTVRGRFRPAKAGGYEAEVYGPDYTLKHLTPVIYKRVLLQLAPGMWGRAYPLAESDRGLVDAVDPHRPVLTWREGAPILSIPSHDYGLKPVLDSILAANDGRLRTADRMIVDLRGNEGGSSLMTLGLEPYLMSDSLRPPVLKQGKAVMLSSPDQMAYARQVFAGPGGVDADSSLQRLLARMKAHPGEMVPLRDSLDRASDELPDSVIPGPSRIAVLVDRGTVSASEAFLERVMRSTRVTVFGEPTAGAIDYQNVGIVPFQPEGRRWYLGYPTIAARADLPAGSIQGKGIPPDVPLDLAHTADPIGEVLHRLSRGR